MGKRYDQLDLDDRIEIGHLIKANDQRFAVMQELLAVEIAPRPWRVPL